MSETDEIKEWQAFSAMHQIAGVLILDKIPSATPRKTASCSQHLTSM